MNEKQEELLFRGAVNLFTAMLATGLFFGYDWLNNGETDWRVDAGLGALVGLLCGPAVADRISRNK